MVGKLDFELGMNREDAGRGERESQKDDLSLGRGKAWTRTTRGTDLALYRRPALAFGKVWAF